MTPLLCQSIKKHGKTIYQLNSREIPSKRKENLIIIINFGTYTLLNSYFPKYGRLCAVSGVSDPCTWWQAQGATKAHRVNLLLTRKVFLDIGECRNSKVDLYYVRSSQHPRLSNKDLRWDSSVDLNLDSYCPLILLWSWVIIINNVYKVLSTVLENKSLMNGRSFIFFLLIQAST